MSSTASPLTTRTNPMSGVFTPPSSCSSHWTYESQAANSVTGGLLIQNAGAGRNDEPCYPPGFGGWGRAPSFIQIFSPGVCPSGYTTANNNYDGHTTTAVCCLSKFGYTNFISSVNAGGKTAQFYGCTSIFTNADPTTVFAEGDDDGVTSSLDGITGMFTTVSGLITMWAQPITVAFQQHDLSLFTTSQSTTFTTTTSQSSTSTTSSTASSETSSTSTSSAVANPASSLPIAAATPSASAISTSYVSMKSLTTSPGHATAPETETSITSSSATAKSSSEMSLLGSNAPTTSPAQIEGPRPGPSTGAIAGIVVGAVALLAIIIGAAIFFRRQRRPTTSPRSLDLMDVQMAQKGHTGVGDSDYTLQDPSWDSGRKGPAELHENELVELPNYRSSRQHELP